MPSKNHRGIFFNVPVLPLAQKTKGKNLNLRPILFSSGKEEETKGQRKVPFTNVHRLTLDNDFLTFMNVSFKCLTYHYLLKSLFSFYSFSIITFNLHKHYLENF